LLLSDQRLVKAIHPGTVKPLQLPRVVIFFRFTIVDQLLTSLTFTSMSLQLKLQSASDEYQKLQNDLSNAVEARQRLEAQLSENELVKKVPALRVPCRARCPFHYVV